LNDFLGILERRGSADVGIRAGAEAFGELASDLQLDLCRIGLKRLQVGVGDDELDTVQPRPAPCG
jgi:hypothetical protein